MFTRMNRTLLAVMATSVTGLAHAVAPYNMSPGVTETTREVFGLHMLIFYICCAIGVVVFGAMIYSIFAHRRSVHPKPADFHESLKVEIAWTVAPFLILIAMAIPAAGTLIEMDDTSGSDLTVKITGYQWMWEYEYLDEEVSFLSRLAPESNQARQLDSGIDVTKVDNYLLDVDQPLVLPVGKKIRLLLTANDVIHSWWVPEITGKKDAIPGYVNKMWVKIDEPGVYRGQCAELCGRDHGFMPIVVKAVEPAEFEQWVASRGGKTDTQVAQAQPVASAPIEVAALGNIQLAEGDAGGDAGMSKEELVAKGEGVYKQNCAACHMPNGVGMPPAGFPSLVDAPKVKGPAEEQIMQVLKGKNAMPPFAYLSDEDIAAVITYTRNSWGNDYGVVEPAAVAAQR